MTSKSNGRLSRGTLIFLNTGAYGEKFFDPTWNSETSRNTIVNASSTLKLFTGQRILVDHDNGTLYPAQW